MFKSLKFSFILSSIAYIVLGITLLLWPTISLKVVCYAFGGITLFYGLVRFVSYLSNRENASLFQGDLWVGILMMAIGIFFLLKPDTILSILPIALGIFILFSSLIKLQHAFELRSASYDKWWILLFLGIVTAALGVVILLNPFETMEMTIMVIGVILIIDGISNIFTIVFSSLVLRRLKRATQDLILAAASSDPFAEAFDEASEGMGEPSEIYEESVVIDDAGETEE